MDDSARPAEALAEGADDRTAEVVPGAVPAVSIDGPLVRKARRGDRDAFRRLHDRYARMVHAILLARVPYGEAADLAQDVFVQAFGRLDGLREDAAFGGWIAMIARNRATDFHRQRRETTELSEAVHGRVEQEPLAEAVQVLEVIKRLPEAYRETLLMRLVEEMTGPEIAAKTGLTAASVRVNLHRGMKLLREALGAEAGPDTDEALSTGGGIPT